MNDPLIAVAQNALDPSDIADAAVTNAVTIRYGSLATLDDVAETTRDAQGLVVTLQPLREQHIAALSESVRVIARAGVGLDSIDVAAAHARGLIVVYQPMYATNEVADQAAAMALASWRRLPTADRLVRGSGWGSFAQLGGVRSLQDSTLGVLGTGRIGRAVIHRLRSFVRRVVVYDPVPDPSLKGVEWADSIESVLALSDLVTLHLPLVETTRHVIDAAAIASMRDGAVLVNVSRGGLIDEAALTSALTSGKIGAAALDVFEQEPLEEDSPLRTAPNLIMTPHLAWYSVESARRLSAWSVEDAVSVLRTGQPRNGLVA
jgi:D-3-phosphoglycerate dehydrogenase